MKSRFGMLLGSIVGVVAFSLSSASFAQYYYFDSGGNSFQQGCAEQLDVRVNAQGVALKGGRLHLVLDPAQYTYSTSDVAATLRTALFAGSTQVFLDWSAAGSPSWNVSSNHTILQLDRSNLSTTYNGSNGLYGSVLFTPVYAPSAAPLVLGMEYTTALDTTKTSLSTPGGVGTINIAQQNLYRTGSFVSVQAPCASDAQAPTISSLSISNGQTKISYLSGLQFSLLDNSSAGSVPYVWTGGGVGVGTWTGNTRGITNQYGIDLSTLVLVISGTNKVILSGTNFSTGDSSASLYAQPQLTTWQFLTKNYASVVKSGALFDYGIEKTVTINGSVKDRNNNSYTLSQVSFNTAVAPTLRFTNPASNGIFVNTTAPVSFGVSDDWAGVNTGSVKLTLQGINGTVYGPYVYSGSDFLFTPVAGLANVPDQDVNLLSHIAFPTSGTIQMTIVAVDMAGTTGTFVRTFSTRPSCSELQCCDPIALQLGSQQARAYTATTLSFTGGWNPQLVWTPGQQTGYLYCGTTGAGLSVFSGHGDFVANATGMTFLETETLSLSGSNVVAVLTGTNSDTILLIRFGSFEVKVFPGSRANGDFSNLGELRFYRASDKQLIISGSLATFAAGTGNLTDNIPSGDYYVVYKGQSHLASYLSGVSIVQGNQLTLDFTTGTNLFNVQNKSLSQDDGFKYQIAGDLKNIQNSYDFMINGNDIAILTMSGFIDGVDLLDPKNLNADTSINVSDLSVIGVNFELVDPFYGATPLFVW